jgi:mannose-6-phosphate isomerase-like protein (cupin superfamily)
MNMDDKSSEFSDSSQALHDSLTAKAKQGLPTFFALQAQLPTEGRTNIPMAASDSMWVVLKTYASGGENELHTHPNEDHTFVILQGKAKFYGPAGEEKIIGKDEGVLLPRGSFYWFHCCSEEPLVMVRVGAASGDAPTSERFKRIDIDGKTMEGDDPRNKQVPVVMSDAWYGRS